MEDDQANQVREALRRWIAIDDEIRTLQTQIKGLRDQKVQIGTQITEFMRNQNLDQFVLEGGGGTIARQQRTTHRKPPRQVIRTQVAMLLADDPPRMAEVLRTIEGLPPPGQEPDAASITTREVLTRRLPRTQQISLGER